MRSFQARAASTDTAADRLPQIELRGVGKRYGDVVGLAPVDLSIEKGEFFSLLGPSGCGKSTLLKLIAGFEEPSSGEVRIAGQSMSAVPPERRRIGFVFQNYALFPNMTVFENVAFGLRAQGLPGVRDRVMEVLALVEMTDYGERRPSQLSGGQQQRVALARALAIEPTVLLLDEPFAALDRKLRQGMQRKLVELQRRLAVTAIFVTHDQEEALTMSDRIAVMSAQRHRIEQVGTPREIYHRPSSVFVSGFIGQTNLWEEHVVAIQPDGSARTRQGFLLAAGGDHGIGESIVVSVRPERIAISAERPDARSVNVIQGRVSDIVFIGDTLTYYVATTLPEPVRVKTLNVEGQQNLHKGATVWLSWSPQAMLPLRATADAKEDDI